VLTCRVMKTFVKASLLVVCGFVLGIGADRTVRPPLLDEPLTPPPITSNWAKNNVISITVHPLTLLNASITTRPVSRFALACYELPYIPTPRKRTYICPLGDDQFAEITDHFLQ